jgi:hypothetical protein
VKDYSVRVSSLEEVFIETGRLDAIKDERENKADEVEMVLGAPPIEEISALQRYGIMTKGSFMQNLGSGKTFLTILLITIVSLLSFVSTYHTYHAQYASQSYLPLSGVFPSQLPIDVIVNE